MDDDQGRCMEIAAPLLPEFHEAWHAAVARYLEYPPQFTAEHDDTTVANCVRSHMWIEVVRRFDGRRGFTLIVLQSLKLLNYKDLLVWRFKKVNSTGRHRNYQTPQQQNFDDQLPLPHIPDAATRLTSGYQLQAASQGIERIIVARTLGRNILWAAQTVVIGQEASWIDITPARLPGTAYTDFSASRARRRR